MRRVLLVSLFGCAVCVSGAIAIAAGDGGTETRSLAPVQRLAVAASPADPAVSADGVQGFDAVWIDGSRAITEHWSSEHRRWGAPIVLARDASDGSPARVAGSESGAGVAAWSTRRGVEVRYRADAAGSWQPGRTLTDAADPQVGIDAHGDAYLVWNAHERIMLAEHPTGASDWGIPVVVASGRPAQVAFLGGPELAVSAAGTVAVAWDHETGSGPTVGGGPPGLQNTFGRGEVLLRARPAGMTRWRNAVALGQATTLPLQGDADPFAGNVLSLAVNSRDTAFVAWQFRKGQRVYPRVAVASEQPDPPPIRELTLPQQAITPVIAASDSSGLVLAATAGRWITPTGRLGARLRARALSTGTSNESVAAADPRGDVVLATGGGTLLDPGRRICQRFTASAVVGAAAIAPNGEAMVIWQHASMRRITALISSRVLSC